MMLTRISLAVFVAFCSPALAEVPLSQASAPEKNPAGVTFELRLKDRRNAFHVGEKITLELVFRSSVPDAFQASTRTYDRSGRLDIDRFQVEPSTDHDDPMADYFSSSGGFMGGGLGGVRTLDEDAAIVYADLNEWIRFQSPGRYRLIAASSRVSRRAPEDQQNHWGTPVELTSNTVELEILPFSAAVAIEQIQKALLILDRPRDPEKEAERRVACRALRFLGTEAAARELARRFTGQDQQCDFEYMAGLFSSPHRALILEMLEGQLESPDHPLTSRYIYTLSALAHMHQYGSLPRYPADASSKAKEDWQKDYNQRVQSRQELYNRYWQRMAVAASGKQGAARALTLETLLERTPAPRRGEKIRTPEAGIADLAGELASLFSHFPAEKQFTLLQVRWSQIAHPAMLPVLRRIWDQPRGEMWNLRDMVLRRLYQLDPDEGRRLILEDIKRAEPRGDTRVLGILPDREIRELDEPLATMLENELGSNTGAPGTHLELVERYATAAILPRMKALYEGPLSSWTCVAALPAYFLRVDPGYGEKALRAGMSGRNREQNCHQRMLESVARLQMSNIVERVAADHLNDPDPEVVRNAVAVLGQKGSPAARKLLEKRLAQWREEWPKRREAVANVKHDDPAMAWSYLESDLVQALTHSPEWRLGRDEVEALRDSCLTEHCRSNARNLLSSWESPITIHTNDYEGRRWYVAETQLASFEAVKKMLARFPTGTEFRWLGNPSDSAEEQLFASLQVYLEASGMKLAP